MAFIVTAEKEIYKYINKKFKKSKKQSYRIFLILKKQFFRQIFFLIFLNAVFLAQKRKISYTFTCKHKLNIKKNYKTLTTFCVSN